MSDNDDTGRHAHDGRQQAAHGHDARHGGLHPARAPRSHPAHARRCAAGASRPRRASPASARFPQRTAIIDELGTLTFDEVHRRSNALASALSDAGVRRGRRRRDHVPQPPRLHRDRRGAPKLGAHALYLNTAFAGPQLAEVVKREKPVALDLRRGVRRPARGRRRPAQALRRPGTTTERSGRPDARRADRGAGDPTPTSCRPTKTGRVVILTSGTTGTPKGAQRASPRRLDAGRGAARPRSRSRRASTTSSPRRCSTPGASRTSRWGCCSARRSCCSRRFDPEARCGRSTQHHADVARRWSR